MATGTIRRMALLALAAIALAAAPLAAAPGAETGQATTGGAAAKTAFKNGKYDPPVEITAVSRVGEIKYLYGDTLDNNVHTRWARDTLGIVIKYVMEPASADAYKQRLQLIIAANEKLPDLVVFVQDPVMVSQLISSGRFRAVDDLYATYASPLYRKYAEQSPSMWYPFMKDGKKYGIPLLEYAYNGDMVYWYREDWMKALNLKAPKTIDELEQVLVKFKTSNPDGLAADKVFPFTFSMKDGTKTWLASLDAFFGSFGTVPMQWNVKKDGTLEYGSINPGAKKALAKLQDWMKKGLVPKDVGLWNAFDATAPFLKGTAGVVPASHWAYTWPLPDVKTAAPKAEWKAYPIVQGPEGFIGGAADRRGSNGCMLINKDCAHPEAFWLYYNYLLENYADPKVGGVFQYGFAEKYDWAMIDGKPVTDRAVLNAHGMGWDDPYTEAYLNFLTGMPGNPARLPDQYFNALLKIANGEPIATAFEKRMMVERGPGTAQGAKTVMEKKDAYVQDQFNGPPTPTMETRWAMLLQDELETFSKIVYGADPAEFDKFVTRWLDNGGRQITQEVNAWYKGVNAKK